MDLTAIAGEYVDGEDVEKIQVLNVNQSEIEVRRAVHLAYHDPPVRLGSTVIDHVIPSWTVEPSALDLNLYESSDDIEDKIIGQSIPDRPKNPPATLQSVKNGCLLCDVSPELRTHGDPAELSPTSYQTAPPRDGIVTKGGDGVKEREGVGQGKVKSKKEKVRRGVGQGER